MAIKKYGGLILLFLIFGCEGTFAPETRQEARAIDDPEVAAQYTVTVYRAICFQDSDCPPLRYCYRGRCVRRDVVVRSCTAEVTTASVASHACSIIDDVVDQVATCPPEFEAGP